MKKYVVNKIMKIINNKYHYSKTKSLEIQYGIESLYLVISKTIVIFLAAYIFGILKELLLLMIFYNILRTTGFGLHTKKSWHCWLSSLLIFLGAPLLSTLVIIPKSIVMIISVICILLIIMYAPADTEKRPIISTKRRRTYKVLCSVSAIIYSIILFFITNSSLENIILFSMIIEVLMILPISYKIFNLKYNNYKLFCTNLSN